MNFSENNRKSALAKIHLGKKQLGLDDETYREMLKNIAKVSSSALLDQAGLDKVLKHMEKSGMVFNKKPKRDIGRKPNTLDQKAQLQKIQALLTDMKLSWSYAEGIAKHMFGKDALEFCSPIELSAIITALSKKQAKGAKNAT